jgi:hypothetical protein
MGLETMPPRIAGQVLGLTNTIALADSTAHFDYGCDGSH